MKTHLAATMCFAWTSGVALCVELPLGVTEAPPCIAFQRQTSTKASLTAIVEGENTEEPANLNRLQACANAAAKKIGLRLIAAQPVEGNPLFKQIFLQCVEENRVPVTVYFVVVKSEDNCDAEEKSTR